MKKIIKAVLVLALCLGLAGCGTKNQPAGDGETNETETTEAVWEPLRIGVVYHGSLKDQGYNESFHAGVCKAAKELEAEVTAFEGNSEDAWYANILAACEDGYDLIIGAGPEVGESIAEYGEKYPEIRFAVMDVTVPLPNVQSVYFDHTECYFQAGALAAELTKQTEVQGINEDAVIGWIGGMNIPVVQEYFETFQAGALETDPEIQILEEYIGSWSDAEEAKELAAAMIEQGADIIMNVASEAGMGVMEAAKENGFYVMTAEEIKGEGWDDVVIAVITEYADRAGYQIVKDFGNGELLGSIDRYLTMKEEAVGLKEMEAWNVHVATASNPE